MDEKHRALFKEHCLTCHNADKQKGKFRLDDLPFLLDSVQTADRWQKILNALNSGDMPPEEEKQPEASLKLAFLDELSGTLVKARKNLGDRGGSITLRRLNRREYRNTMRDLLGVDVRVAELPADGGAGAFDTVGASLFMSSDQIEQYLALGRQALDESFARYVSPQPARKMHLEVEDATQPKIAKALRERIDAHERYLQWTAAVDAAALLPENSARADSIRAANPGNATRLYSDWQKISGAPAPSDFGFTDAVHADEQGRRDWVHYVPHHRAYLEEPGAKTGAFLTIEDVFVNPYQAFRLPGDWPAGNYVVRVRIAATDAAAPERRFVEFGPQHDSGVCAVSSAHQVTGTMAAPQILEIPLTLPASGGRGFFLREKGTKDSEESAHRLFEEALKKNGVGPAFALWIDWIEVEGQDNKTAVRRDHREAEELANRVAEGTYSGYYKGGYEKALAWQKSDRSKPPKDFGLSDEGEVDFRILVFGQHAPTFEKYLTNPLTKTGSLLMHYNVHTEEVVALPPDTPSDWDRTKRAPVEPGEYVVRVRIGALPGTPAERHFVEMGTRTRDVEFALARTFQISGTLDAPQTLEVPVSIAAGGPRSFVFREKRDVKNDAALYEEARKRTGTGPDAALWIDWVEWEGPLPPQGAPDDMRVLLSEQLPGAGDTENARSILERFAIRAFRDVRPEPGYLERLVQIYERRRAAGTGFNGALKDAMSVVLASPGFLYLSEPASKSRPLTARELATRLSYFLWSGPPDETLLALARSGQLQKAGVLSGEVDRVLASPKSREFVLGFVHQWLGMERLDFFQFNTVLFREFDESTKAAARAEVYESFAYLLRENGSLRSLLKSDYVVVNGLLAAYYGLEGVTGDTFRKVPLPGKSPRGGLLGMAAVLAMGSNGEQTSPVERGAWVLRKLLHEPPPPAPPNVPQLSRLEGQLLNTRERLRAHQQEPQCANCHRKIDPLGFGLENFDAAGKWRTEETYEKKGVGKKSWPIEAAAAFHHGPAFADFFELRDLVAARPGNFARGFTEALMEYALGRPLSFIDTDVAAGIVERAKTRDFAVREFVQALVASPAFQSK